MKEGVRSEKVRSGGLQYAVSLDEDHGPEFLVKVVKERDMMA